MKLVINNDYGCFEMPNEIALKIEAKDACDRDMTVRTNPVLIDWVEDNQDVTDLIVVEIPDECSDYCVVDYDGIESVIFVLDGELYAKGNSATIITASKSGVNNMVFPRRKYRGASEKEDKV